MTLRTLENQVRLINIQEFSKLGIRYVVHRVDGYAISFDDIICSFGNVYIKSYEKYYITIPCKSPTLG